MRRREFIKLIAGSAAVWPLAAHAQKPALPVIGFLSAEWPDLFADRLRGFHAGLGEAGYVERQNVNIEYRWAEGRIDQLPTLAADLVRRQVNVIVAVGSTPAALAAKAATSTIPTVFYVGTDPVKIGLVASFNHPGGNITGVTTLNVQIAAKRLELMHELLPKATVIAALVNPANPIVAETSERDLLAATSTLGLQLHVLRASTEREIDDAFATLVRLRASALLIDADALFTSLFKQLAALATRYGVPAIQASREFVVAGGLISYGNIPAESYRQVGVYAGRLLKGEKPGDLPVQQATKVNLAINLKTAKALGLDVPNTLIGRADEVIE
jgi:putative tryptophan/tyrosine transport system substrate-binding protein